MALTPKAAANRLLKIILGQDADRLQKIDEYVHGQQDRPYMPDTATDEYEMLSDRSVTNMCGLLVNTPAQSLYVDSFRPGREVPDQGKKDVTPEWKHWQDSRLDSRQMAVHRGALTFGHSFTLTEKNAKGKVLTTGMSALTTAAIFKDPANDDTPTWALHITTHATKDSRGEARMWDSRSEYVVTYTNPEEPESTRVKVLKRHGASECPVTRFAAYVDLEGRTIGVVEPMMVLQDRINQTHFDLLVAQTYASIKVRTVSGMAPPMKVRWVTNSEGEKVQVPEVDENGRPIPLPVRHLGSRLVYSKDPATKFGTLDETPLGGFIDSVELSLREFASISQTPPHYMLGQMANLSADALKSAEIALSRKTMEFRNVFGESWERVFRLAAELNEIEISEEDMSGEVGWRDVDLGASISQAADGLGKLRSELGAPKRGLWKRVPNMTDNELREWNEMADEEERAQSLSDSLTGVRPTVEPIRRPRPSPRPGEVPAA